MFQKIPVPLPKHVGYIEKQKTLLTDIYSKWFMEKHKSKIPSMKRAILSKVENNREDDIKQNHKKISSTLELLETPNPFK